eukprot:1289133-Pyramimonas_sp.AAC.1
MLLYGFEVNYKRTKTALVPSIRGPGSGPTKKQVYGKSPATISSRRYGLVVHVEVCYKHLGTVIDKDGSVGTQ